MNRDNFTIEYIKKINDLSREEILSLMLSNEKFVNDIVISEAVSYIITKKILMGIFKKNEKIHGNDTKYGRI